ncbi:MAG TPA: hypothetical protein VJ991_14430 [Balneolales bacterium]|nr:hypothetical protein [Balneolales bacterium]
MKNNVFVGLALDGEVIRVAKIKKEHKKLKLLQLDRVTLVDSESIYKNESNSEEKRSDSIFGFEENGSGKKSYKNGKEVIKETDLLTLTNDPEMTEIQNNETLVYNLLSNINRKKVVLGANIPAGSTLFQIMRDQNYQNLKKKELEKAINTSLESVYGAEDSDHLYRYEKRKDGALVIASTDSKLTMLDLIDQGQAYYSGKVFINEILPEESAMVGLVKTNYELKELEMTGIIIMGSRSMRLVFLRGNDIWAIPPVINKGSNSPQIMNTIFSKILWQIDTGEIPNIDRLILVNNVLGDRAVTYLRENFPDIKIDDFIFDEKKFEIDSNMKEAIAPFTTAIGMAWAAAGYTSNYFKDYSFLPKHVKERQKVLKLRWHGLLLLLLIAMSPVILNNRYQIHKGAINNLRTELSRTKALVSDLSPIVFKSNQFSEKLDEINNRLNEISDLSLGSGDWSKILTLLNNGFKNINSCWITNMRSVKSGIILQGFSLYRDRIPHIANVFKNSELQKVSVSKIRKTIAYKFTIYIRTKNSNKSDVSTIKEIATKAK